VVYVVALLLGLFVGLGPYVINATPVL
jgi:hypothetical protein